jgi:hypothetical protein
MGAGIGAGATDAGAGIGGVGAAGAGGAAGAPAAAGASRPIAKTALQMLQRARTPPSGTLAGSTR